MSLTKHKLKKQMMEKTLEKAAGERTKKEDNPKILPYYKLDFGQKLEVMFLPYEDGELIKHFKKHGPNMGNASAGSINCIWHADGESCPACAKGYSYVKDGKGTPESKKWMPKDYFVAQCVVLESPFDIIPLEDENQVRMFYMPFAVMEKIKESYAEGIVEDPTEHVFVIKKTKNQGGEPSYANSYFKPLPAEQEIYDLFEDAVVELHDLVAEKVAPEPATTEQVEEWVEKAEKLLAGSSNKNSNESSNKASSNPSDSDDSSTDDSSTPADDDDKQEAPEPEPQSKGLSLKERLRQQRAAK